jgi:hypothetical protein
MNRKLYARTLAITAILTSLAWLQASSAKADVYFVECCNANKECDYDVCNTGNTLVNWLQFRFAGACGTTASPPGGKGTCTYDFVKE